MTITIVYDNYPHTEGLATGWGFSAVVSGAARTILFDTGRDEAVVPNMERLGFEPKSIEVMVLSHVHWDHTGGVVSFLERNPDVSIYLPESFPEKLKNEWAGYGAEVIEVDEPVEICDGAWSTGQMGWVKREQGLVLQEARGVVVILGCAHPGVVKMVRRAKELTKGDVFAVFGGFHFEWASGRRIEKVISKLKDLGVQWAGPCHCSGEKARGLFEKHFGKKYVEMGAGKTIRICDLGFAI
jgi:7,8-dihydropterin-6-yl-methyl-4-(beta-D-ribofuranosyl)aminobenzene 5'-phosphate synthase